MSLRLRAAIVGCGLCDVGSGLAVRVMMKGTGAVLTAADMGMPLHHPVTTEITVELDVVDGRTKMVMIHAGIPKDSPGATGWAMAFDKLAAYLSARQEH